MTSLNQFLFKKVYENGHSCKYLKILSGGPRVVLSAAAFHARVRGSVPGLGVLKKKMFLPHPRVKVSIVGSLRDREVACSASDPQGSNFESCVWRTVSSQSSHHPQEVILAQFSLYVHKGGIKPDSFHLSEYISLSRFNSFRWKKLYLNFCQLFMKYKIFAISFVKTARARISNPVSGGQCHLNHLTILRRFSWPSLAYMCTKVA